VEQVGHNFSIDGMLTARAMTRQAISNIAKCVEPGMVEEDAVAMAKQELHGMGLSLNWHPVRVRFGTNTTKAMRQASAPSVVLETDDIFFIDIAPRYQRWEGDGGASFAVGNNPDHRRCAHDAEALFHDVRQQWLLKEWTGMDLYRYAEQRANELGWELNFDLPGHRISDFPHAAIHTGSLADAKFRPSAMRWILEIHLLDPQGRFGAFFEDMLLDNSQYAM
jgi:hypothetical protein